MEAIVFMPRFCHAVPAVSSPSRAALAFFPEMAYDPRCKASMNEQQFPEEHMNQVDLTRVTIAFVPEVTVTIRDMGRYRREGADLDLIRGKSPDAPASVPMKLIAKCVDHESSFSMVCPETDAGTMLPAMLRKVRDIVEEGRCRFLRERTADIDMLLDSYGKGPFAQ